MSLATTTPRLFQSLWDRSLHLSIVHDRLVNQVASRCPAVLGALPTSAGLGWSKASTGPASGTRSLHAATGATGLWHPRGSAPGPQGGSRSHRYAGGACGSTAGPPQAAPPLPPGLAPWRWTAASAAAPGGACLANRDALLGVQCRTYSSRGGLSQKAQAALSRRRAMQRTLQQDLEPSAAAGPSGDRAPGSALGPPEGQSVVLPSSGPASEVTLKEVFEHPALVVTRDIEWGTVLIGFEQANKYTIFNNEGEVVALMAEDLGGLAKGLGRQVLGTHRPFTATVLSPDGGQILFRVRRPFYVVNSNMYIESSSGEVIGEVHQKWHPLRRNYELFLGKKQVAYISGQFLAWEFVIRDEAGGVLAVIDRNFQGFAKELFTDAGKYVIHFGGSPLEAAENVRNTVAAAHPDKPAPEVKPLPESGTGSLTVIPQANADQLVVSRPMALSERMLALAAAICIDFNYFSQHSNSGGLAWPWLLLPVPSPPVPSYPDPPVETGAAVPPDAATGEHPGTAGETGTDGAGGLERDLGNDAWGGGPSDGAGSESSGLGGDKMGWGEDDDNKDDGDDGDDEEGGGWGGLFGGGGGGGGGGGLFEGW